MSTIPTGERGLGCGLDETEGEAGGRRLLAPCVGSGSLAKELEASDGEGMEESPEMELRTEDRVGMRGSPDGCTERLSGFPPPLGVSTLLGALDK